MKNFTIQYYENNLEDHILNISVCNKSELISIKRIYDPSKICDPLELSFVIPLVVISASILMNGIGAQITCLTKKNTNQNCILFYLSLNEIMFGIFLMIGDVNFEFKVLSPLLLEILRIVTLTFDAQIAAMMYMLTLDRLICAINPLKYKVRVTKTKIRMGGFLTFSFSVSAALFDNYFLELHFFYLAFWIAGSLYVLLVIVTYGFIIYRTRRSNQQLNASATIRRGKKMEKKYLVPCLIISTFLLLNCSPVVIHGYSFYEYIQFRVGNISHQVSYVIMCVGLVTDPLIYIFLSKYYRILLIKVLRKVLICKCYGEKGETQTVNAIEPNQDSSIVATL